MTKHFHQLTSIVLLIRLFGSEQGVLKQSEQNICVSLFSELINVFPRASSLLSLPLVTALLLPQEESLEIYGFTSLLVFSMQIINLVAPPVTMSLHGRTSRNYI